MNELKIDWRSWWEISLIIGTMVDSLATAALLTVLGIAIIMSLNIPHGLGYVCVAPIALVSFLFKMYCWHEIETAWWIRES